MNSKRIWVGLLCVFLIVLLVDDLFAKEQKQQQPSRKRRPRGSWKGTEIGSVIKDF